MVINLTFNNDCFDYYVGNYNTESRFLYLKYPCIEEQTEKCWEKNIMDMNEKYPEYNILQNTEILFLYTDSYFSFPQIFLKFINLKKLEIKGSRWWYLNCNQIPVTIEHLILIEHTNLKNDVMKGSESLINLHTLELDASPFLENCNFNKYYTFYGEINNEFYNNIFDYDDIYPIPDIGNLKNIFFHIYGTGYDDIIDYDYYNIIINHKLFSNIKNRIKKIYTEINNKYIIITLD